LKSSDGHGLEPKKPSGGQHPYFTASSCGEQLRIAAAERRAPTLRSPHPSDPAPDADGTPAGVGEAADMTTSNSAIVQCWYIYGGPAGSGFGGGPPIAPASGSRPSVVARSAAHMDVFYRSAGG
jgi:hypothetical protein